MGLLLAFWLALTPCLGFAAWSNNLELPSPAPVVDEAGLLQGGEAERLRGLLSEIKRRSGVEISVYIASSLRERPLEDFSLAAAEKWGLGTKKEDKGLLFVVAPQEKQMRFEVGYGLEGDITDVFSRRVLDNQVRPFFREGRFYEGILAGIVAIQEKVPMGLTGQEAPRKPKPRSGGSLLFTLLMIFFVFAFFSRVLGPGRSYRRRYGGWGGPFIGGGGWGGGGGGGGFGSWGGGGGGFGGGGASSNW